MQWYYVIIFLNLIPNMGQQVEWCKQYNVPSVEEGTATTQRSKGFQKIKFNHALRFYAYSLFIQSKDLIFFHKIILDQVYLHFNDALSPSELKIIKIYFNLKRVFVATLFSQNTIQFNCTQKLLQRLKYFNFKNKKTLFFTFF